MNVYFLVFSLTATLNEPAEVIGKNCMPMKFEMASGLAELLATDDFAKQGLSCQKREGMYEWLCLGSNEIRTITIMKDEADCKARPERTRNQLRMMMKKPTL